MWFIVIMSILLPALLSTGSLWMLYFSLFFICFSYILNVPFVSYVQTRAKMREKEVSPKFNDEFKRKVIAFSIVAGVVESLIFYLSMGTILKLILFLISLF